MQGKKSVLDASHSQDLVDRLDIGLDLGADWLSVARLVRSQYSSRHRQRLPGPGDREQISRLNDLPPERIGNLVVAAADSQHGCPSGTAQVERREAPASGKTFRVDANCDRLAQPGNDGVRKLQPFCVGL